MNFRRASVPVVAGLVFLVCGASPTRAAAQGVTYSLTLNAAGNGRTSPAAGTYTYAAETEVLVTALPGPGDRFVGWTGGASGTSAQIVVVMGANTSVTATFAQGKSPVSMLPNPPGVRVPRPHGVPGNLTVLDWAGFRGAISYTFDDSLDSQIQNYALLKAPGVPLTFYVNPTTTSIYTDAQRVAALRQWMADGNELGNHTYYHCSIASNGTLEAASCLWSPDTNPPTGDTWQAEIGDTTAWIENTVGHTATTDGRHSPRLQAFWCIAASGWDCSRLTTFPISTACRGI